MKFAGVTCPACRTLAAEVLVPDGAELEGCAAFCFLCAHMIAIHEIPPPELARRLAAADGCVWCACGKAEIYPAAWLEEQERLRNSARKHLARPEPPHRKRAQANRV